MNFISDLDKTIVYSREKTHKCIEKHDSKEITFITETSNAILNELFENKKFNFIPCTLRSLEQTMRIDFIRNNNLKYMICDNGASIYVDGVIDENWDKVIDSFVNRTKVKQLEEIMNDFAKEYKIPIYKIKTNRNAFISIIFYDKNDAYVHIDKLLSFVDNDFNIFKQGKKTYVVPKGLNKSIAVQYLKEHYRISNIITSGDSSVDEEFVKCGDKIILPKHCVFSIPNATITQHSGILAGEEIIEYVNTNVLTLS